MKSILEFIYVLFFVPCDKFLYISLLFISAISVYIIVQQSRPIGPIDIEASTSKLTAQHTHELPASQQFYHAQKNEGYHDSQPATSKTEAESENNENKTCQLPSQSSNTSTSIRNTPPAIRNPLQVLAPISQHDSLLETGSLFANDNHNSNAPSPRSHQLNHNRHGSASLELSD
jgi:hypothetical protein